MKKCSLKSIVSKPPVLYFFLFLFVFCCLGLISPDVFWGQYNLQSMCCQIPEFGILALGMMVAIITGGIDLSMTSSAVLSGVIASLAMYKYMGAAGDAASGSILMVIIAISCVLTGFVLGVFNGVLISFFKIPAILATLGTMKLYEGISTIITKGEAFREYPEIVSRLANESVFLVPTSFYIFVLACILLWILLEKTKSGMAIYLYGESPKVSCFSGLNNNKTLMKAYCICGVMSGLSGLIMMSRFNSVKVGYGSTYQLLTVLVAIMGGVHPDGGKGNVLCVAFSVLTLQCIASGFNILDFSNYIRNVIYGAVLIMVMIVYVMYPIYAQKRAIRLRHSKE